MAPISPKLNPATYLNPNEFEVLSIQLPEENCQASLFVRMDGLTQQVDLLRDGIQRFKGDLARFFENSRATYSGQS